MPRRLRTRSELLAAWRLEAELAAAAEDERAEALAAFRLDAVDPWQGDVPVTHDALVRLWARDALRVELLPDDPVPVAILEAFRRGQDGLWAGAPVSLDVLLDSGPDSPVEPPVQR